MASPVRHAIVGCGGMGRRHLAGLVELARAGDRSIELIAVCDLNLQNANDLADEAEQLTGARPTVFQDAAHMVEQSEGLEGASCTTDTGSHHIVAAALLDLGLHTLCEKPLALTIRGCQHIIEAANRNNRLLSVAENFRRDPMNRLVRALLEGGAIGERQFIMEAAIRGRDSLFITPWRHQKLTGTITLDAGVHSADILQYYFGNPVSAFGHACLYEPTRYVRDAAGPGGYYAKWAGRLPEKVTATGEDAIFGLITFESGALGQWTDHYAGHGEPFHRRLVFGTKGSIEVPGDRNGNPVRLVLDDGMDISDERILNFAPSFRLDPIAAKLFESDRPWSYGFDFLTTDRKLLALEYHEFGSCIRNNTPPEVGGTEAMRAVSLVYALFESQATGCAVSLADIESSQVDAYQREIDEHLGLVSSGTGAGA